MHIRELHPRDQVLSVTDKIYAAALEPARWDVALEAMRDALDGAAASLRFEALEPAPSLRQTWLGFEPGFQKAYFEHYWREDVCSSLWPVGRTETADTLVPVDVRRRAAFFHELCVPFQLDDVVGGRLESTESGSITLAIMKARGRKPFGGRHTAFLDAIIPHLRRAVRINAALEHAENATAFAWSIVDRVPVGIFALERTGRVLHVNRTGELLLGDGLHVRKDGIAGELPAATIALRRCIAGFTDDEVTLTLPRRSGAPLLAVAMPCDREMQTLGGGKYVDVLLVVSDPDAQIEPSARVLSRLFGLTPAETRVALLLARGLAPKEVATELGSSWNTVRFQLRQVYAKTHTTGQLSLVRLLTMLGVAAPSHPPG